MFNCADVWLRFNCLLCCFFVVVQLVVELVVWLWFNWLFGFGSSGCLVLVQVVVEPNVWLWGQLC